MAKVNNQQITEEYALYNGDCIEVLPSIPDESIHLSVYSPPFAGLYQYSSADNDLSNCSSYESFMDHYRFVVREIARVTMPGRLTCVHVTDVPEKGALIDFPGDVIRLHQEEGFKYHDRHAIWKEPLRVAIRTRAKGLMHKYIVEDATECRTALADYMLVFKKEGQNLVPVTHPKGLQFYAGSTLLPPELEDKYLRSDSRRNFQTVDDFVKFYQNWDDPQTNKLAHVIWQRYASAFWDDIRIDNVLKYKEARESEEEKHVHPLQLDAIDRCVQLWTNPGETVLTPFMGVGSEVYSPVSLGRKGIGIELKETYYRQAVENLKDVEVRFYEQPALF